MWDDHLAVAGGAAILLVLLAATLVTGTDVNLSGDGNLVIDGSDTGQNQSDRTLHVPSGMLASVNGSYTIHNEDRDVCIGRCENLSSRGGD